MGDCNIPSNVTGNLVNAIGGVKSYNGVKPEDSID